jgi:hypothetical protein
MYLMLNTDDEFPSWIISDLRGTGVGGTGVANGASPTPTAVTSRSSRPGSTLRFTHDQDM